MYNTNFPTKADLPSSERLVRSTIVAAVSAMAILVTVVLPSEYGIDLTGFGRLTGLKTMGDIKMQLAEEAAANERLSAQVAAGTAPIQMAAPADGTAADIAALSQRVSMLEQMLSAGQVAPPPATSLPPVAAPLQQAQAEPVQATPSGWRDEISFTLAPMQGTEYKLVMDAGAVATFQFVVDGGVVNYDAHGEGGGQSLSYEEVRGVDSGGGQLQPPISGTHGWFFRNRGEQAITVTLRTGGAYSELRKIS